MSSEIAVLEKHPLTLERLAEEAGATLCLSRQQVGSKLLLMPLLFLVVLVLILNHYISCWKVKLFKLSATFIGRVGFFLLKVCLFVCLFVDGFMSGCCYFFTSNWMQKTCSVFLLLGPA